MTILYKPVLIESAEQAEALSEGAVVINRDSGDKYHRGLDGTWWSDHDMGGPLSMDLEHDTIEALVPIGAKEETRQRDARPIRSLNDPRWKSPFDDHEGDQWVEESRYVTPWEEA